MIFMKRSTCTLIFIYVVFSNMSAYSYLNRMIIRKPSFLPIMARSSSLYMSTSASTLSKSPPNRMILGDTRDRLNHIMREVVIRSYPTINIKNIPHNMIAHNKLDHGDYQSNAAMMLAKELKSKPQDIARKFLTELKSYDNVYDDVYDEVTLSGPGFLNFKLSDAYIKQRIISMLVDDQHRLGITQLHPNQQHRVIVDFSSPNIAKEMHVGHLRSTIIGDTISRVLEFIGYDVLRLNHVGDWGTQFGMLIHYMKTRYPVAIKQYLANHDHPQAGSNNTITAIQDLVLFYKAAKKSFDDDQDNFKDHARAEVVKLQAGDSENMILWQAICQQSRQEFQQIYHMLNINVTERGESYYNPYLEDIVDYMRSKGLAVDSQGATCIFVPGYNNTDGTPLPLIIKKSDGGYLYATTDLAAIRHRVDIEQAKRLIYITDEGQAQHFAMVFAAARAADMIPDDVHLIHVPFGVVQGDDGKKFKSRSGDTVRLKDLLDDAIEYAEKDMIARKRFNINHNNNNHNHDVNDMMLSEEEVATAKVIGLAAVKYADLSMNRESNYRFSYDKMLALSGNTAPYMLYAYARIQGIQRKAVASLNTSPSSSSELSPPSSSSYTSIHEVKLSVDEMRYHQAEEVALAKHLIRWDEVLLDVARDLYPNKMCDYLFELSQKFNQFYEKCPVLKAEGRQQQISRVALCTVTAEVLKVSLGLLGINVVEKL